MCRIIVVICCDSEYTTKLNLKDEVVFELRIYFDILVPIRVDNHPRLSEHVIEGVVRMAMDPQAGAMVDDLMGKVGHEGAIEAVSSEPFMDGKW